MKLTDDVKQRKQKHFKQYRTAKQKLTNKENLVRFLHRGKPKKCFIFVVIRLVIRFFGYYVLGQYERSTVFCTSSRAQEKYSSDRDSARLRVLDLTSQGD